MRSALLLLLATLGPRAAAAQGRDLEREIYRVVVNNHEPGLFPATIQFGALPPVGVDTLAIFPERVPAYRLDPKGVREYVVKELPSADLEALEDLLHGSGELLAFPEDLKTTHPYVVMTPGSRHPQSASLGVSPIGLNRSKTAAVVEVDYGCGNLCGYRGLDFLRRTKNGWEPVGSVAFVQF